MTTNAPRTNPRLDHLRAAPAAAPYKASVRIRAVTATSLFDGHDATINLVRRLLQASGVEVIHLGHSRSVREVVEAAVQEDVQAVAVTCYQGGHLEFFTYMQDMLRELGCGHVRIFGGGGGVIRPHEIAELHGKGIAGIYSPEDGRRLGLQGMINHLLERADFPTVCAEGDFVEPRPDDERRLPGFRGMPVPGAAALSPEAHPQIARLVSLAEAGGARWEAARAALQKRIAAAGRPAPVIGVTGTGGAGKSSLCDELVRRFLLFNPGAHVAVLAADPSKRTTGGALLGDRIRMNAVHGPRAYMRSFATRASGVEFPPAMEEALWVLKAAGFDAIFVETSGIGQRDSAVTRIADVSMYVMTSEYGASSQLEKIDMLDLADVIVLNKYERRGSEDAVRELRHLYRRSRGVDPSVGFDDYPVFGTMASQFNDPGVNALYAHLVTLLNARGAAFAAPIPKDRMARVTFFGHLFPPERVGYLGEIAQTCRAYRARVRKEAGQASRAQALLAAADEVGKGGAAREGLVPPSGLPAPGLLREKADVLMNRLSEDSREALAWWDGNAAAYGEDEMVYCVRGREVRAPLTSETLAGTKVPKVALPRLRDRGDLLEYLMLEGVPGRFPYTAGDYPFKRTDEDPKRQFAGEGGPEKTNRRFHYLCRDDNAKRLSTAFDSVTLYGGDPDRRPDIYGKVGESGVSVCTLDDAKKLYAGFDLVDPNTSVSMTINGPAPIMLAFFFNAAIDREVDRFRREQGREPDGAERERLEAATLAAVRGTVQADILKEDQGQNTCIFSIDFALKMMGDVQECFIRRGVRNFYSVSISGYHIAEAGANPVTQLAYTLADGFTYVEYYLSRGMRIDDFGPNLSFFFSNGMDAEYAVLGRVARRIWAVAMREKYGADERTQKLKYHIQTSGRSLHEQDAQFNDIRTTLQGLLAIYDNCNSLHTNSYDEAITTPTEESVRRAMAIQMIVNREFGLTKNENPLQGSHVIEWLTDHVEEMVLREFERLSERGGVLGAMELQYQRSRIQEESLLYETKKHDGSLPLVGVNTFIDPARLDPGYREPEYELRRATPEEKEGQLGSLAAFKERHAAEAGAALARLKEVAIAGGNIFEEMMRAARVASLGQIVEALYEVGGQYRRAM